MQYRGYIAAVEFDEMDQMLHGHVINSGPYSIVTFEAPDMERLQREFQLSIDEYLRWCAEDSVEPVRPGSPCHANPDPHRRATTP